MQKFMDKKECKNFLVTIHNLSPHSFISIKLSSGCDHQFHEECGNSFTNIYQQWFVESTLCRAYSPGNMQGRMKMDSY
jgi:hypothetical protein